MRCYYFLLFLAGITGCKHELNKKLDAISDTASLNIATFDGSGQLVHPDILYHNDSFYLAATPYPFFNDSLENPCFYKSADGIHFTEYAPGLNPLVPTPAYDHNDDPDLLYDSLANEFQIYYLETMRPDSQNVILLTSRHGSAWKKHTVLRYNLLQGDIFILSPAVVRGYDNKERMFYVVKGDSTNHIEFLEKNQAWVRSAVQQIQIDYPAGFTPWHLDVLRQGRKYYLLCNGYYGKSSHSFEASINQYALLLFASDDLKTWTFQKQLLDCNSISAECHYVYRTTGLISGNLLVLWYSYVTSDRKWKMGVKKMRF